VLTPPAISCLGAFPTASELVAGLIAGVRRAESGRIELSGNIALTQLHYFDAAEHFKQATALVPSGHPDQMADYLHRQAYALCREGDERGDNAALKQSIETWHLVLQQRPRDRVPLEWAMTQNNLGNTLKQLGERESGTARLKEAVAAYRAALEERTRDRVPLDWAMTQNNLGNALDTGRAGERDGASGGGGDGVSCGAGREDARSGDGCSVDRLRFSAPVRSSASTACGTRMILVIAAPLAP
jgi:tetratricopeptide (TPR) repeat protein